jgi:hypothetical protein
LKRNSVFDHGVTLPFREAVVDRVRHQDLDKPDRLARLVVVVHRDLALAVRGEERVSAALERSHHPADEDVGEREKLRGFVAGETVHNPLVAGADLLVFSGIGPRAHVDVGRLRDDRVQHAEGVAVQADGRVIVPQSEDRLPDALVQVDPGPCADFATDDAEPLAEEDLDAAVRHGVDVHSLLVFPVQDGGDDVGRDHVRDNVRVSDLDAFR